MNNEIIFDPFAGLAREPEPKEPCNCEKMRPVEIVRRIPKILTPETDVYICNWCSFIKNFGMEDALADIENELEGGPLSSDREDDEYDDDFDEGGLEDLEDWGAFSDEGIMAGCHSSYDDDIGWSSYLEGKRLCRFFGAVNRFARESLGLSVHELAEHLELPEYMIENLEAGEDSIKYNKTEMAEAVHSARAVKPLTTETVHSIQILEPLTVENRAVNSAWWTEIGEDEIVEKIQDFLLAYKDKDNDQDTEEIVYVMENPLPTINEYLENILRDFKSCACESVKPTGSADNLFDADTAPDYSDLRNQQIYLLRNAYSDAYEYKYIYQQLIQGVKLPSRLSVLSIGCGAMLDYWALVDALHSPCTISYQGVDRLNWAYQMEARPEDSVSFTQSDALSFLNDAKRLPYDIYFFQESVREFSLDDMEQFARILAKKVPGRKSITVIFSLRKDSEGNEQDLRRIQKFIEVMQQGETFSCTRRTPPTYVSDPWNQMPRYKENATQYPVLSCQYAYWQTVHFENNMPF